MDSNLSLQRRLQVFHVSGLCLITLILPIGLLSQRVLEFLFEQHKIVNRTVSLLYTPVLGFSLIKCKLYRKMRLGKVYLISFYNKILTAPQLTAPTTDEMERNVLQLSVSFPPFQILVVPAPTCNSPVHSAPKCMYGTLHTRYQYSTGIIMA